MNANFGTKFSNLQTAFGLQEQAKGAKAATLAGLTTSTTPDESQARNAAAQSAGFYPAFVESLEQANLLKSDGKMIRVAVVLD